jgi:hypothetical protein
MEADLVRHDEKARLAQAIIDSRRSRQRHLPEAIFGEYAWDALLHLFVADAASQRLTGHSLVERIGCAPRVMTRWLMYLSQAGLVVGDGDGDLSDLLTMAPYALNIVEAYLAEMQELARRYIEAL